MLYSQSYMIRTNLKRHFKIDRDFHGIDLSKYVLFETVESQGGIGTRSY
jgi:hypothetical protein